MKEMVDLSALLFNKEKPGKAPGFFPCHNQAGILLWKWY
ncbi:hypothetical protein FTV88_1688 [Heliorestis convoluta]|uniref:Uncharacterized protein n=1 Tax=Heliorestis convoluta TaxID=356322 RepID=A0A5Q2MYQ3_9FIRM|nr:hypothetical protein FTV88_1688 [Heliorestis convoluta]